ncbi:MAG TPA: metallophosphoesterase [Elusimicrobiota bacterium]|nr:metallophosphoesterase [Elusimicrobiota bacterium]
MFGSVMTGVVSLMHVYVFWRACTVPFVTARVPRKGVAALGLLMWSVFFLGRVLGHGGTGPAAAALEFLGMNWMGALFLMTVTLLAADVLTLFGLVFKKYAPGLRGAALLTGLALAAFALVQGLRPPVVRSDDVPLAGLPSALDGKVLVVISDLHLGSQTGAGRLDAVVARAAAQKPDMVLLLGDITEGHDAPPETFLFSLRRLSAPWGVWGVLGNHDPPRRAAPADGSLMEQAGIPVLRNAWVEVQPGLVLAGRDGRSVRRGGLPAEEALEKTLAGRPAGATIFLSHYPDKAEAAARAGVGLMLSGHTHGGQVWPFGYLVRQRYPRLGGRYRIGDMTLLVCRGTGTWGPRLRLWHPNEILRITLRRKNAE